MRTVRRRRRIDLLLLALGALLVGVVALLGAVAGDGERIPRLWAGAAVAGDGNAQVVEVIDYDFGAHPRHGIYRDVPGLRPDAPVRVASPTAPAQVQLSDLGGQTRIRIGDPSRTVTGRHRYTIAYPLGGVGRGGRLAWDAVGTGWPVGIGRAEIHLVAPFRLAQPRCVQGRAGSTRPCQVTPPR